MKSPTINFKKVGVAIGALATSFALKKLMETGYQNIFKEDPPNRATIQDVHWGKIIGWTVATGIATTATKVLLKRYTASEYGEELES